jgi:hypothetical protein
MTEVRITNDGALCCPSCDNVQKIGVIAPYMHHGVVTVYNRHEDAADLVVTQVSSGRVTTNIAPSQGSWNPSMRRDGLAIRFNCEFCNQISELTIEQHKGQTFLGWRQPESQPVTAASTENVIVFRNRPVPSGDSLNDSI